MAEFPVITDVDEFLQAASTLAAGTGPAAVDVERASGFRYTQRAYLIQVYRRDAGVYLFDPPALGDMAPLQEAIGDVEWVLHAASQDLPSLREENLEPPSIFDTELAARLLGHARVGLGAVVEDTLGITLAKAHSAADWSTRPLPQSWLEYAALDVLHLIDVRDALALELEEQGKTPLAHEEFEAVRTRPAKPPREEPWRRLSGLHTVRGRRALAVARALWTAREEFAKEQDVSPGRLVPDRALVAAVQADPATKQDLARTKEFIGRASRTQLDRWWAAIEAGRASEDQPPLRVRSDEPPPPRFWKSRKPEADVRLRHARAAVQAVAEELSMPAENLLAPDAVRRLAWDPIEPTVEAVAEALRQRDARPWQVAATAQRIAVAFVEADQAGPDPSDDPS